MAKKRQMLQKVTTNFASLARRIYDGLGADANVTSIDNCTTRLRLTVKDTGKSGSSKN